MKLSWKFTAALVKKTKLFPKYKLCNRQINIKEQPTKFKNKFLLLTALTHKSANQKSNNEKLEFLGDRVIGLVLSKKLFDLYPGESEGVLDKKFASLVKRKTCCDIAWSIGIQKYIITGNILVF